MDEEDKVRKLKIATDNIKYLESQLLPLAESNAKLKESIHAMQYYMEQRRQDFAQLINYNEEKELKINLGDMVTIFEWLKKDIENYTQQIIELEKESTLYQELIKDQDQQHNQLKEKFNQIVQKQEQQITQLNQELQQELTKKQKQIEEFKNQEQIVITQVKKQYDEKIELINKEKFEVQFKYNQLDEEYQQKLKKLRQDLINQYDRQERSNQIEFIKQKSELTDQIQKLDLKNKQLVTELQNIKADHQTLLSSQSQYVSNNKKLTRQVDNLLQTIKTSREEISVQNKQKVETDNQIENLKKEVEKQIKKENELHQYIKTQTQVFQDFKDKMINQENLLILQITGLMEQIDNDKKLIQEKEEQMKNTEQILNEKITKQRIKYEQQLYPGSVINESQLLYQDKELQYEDISYKVQIEEYEALISQYSNQSISLEKQMKLNEEIYKQKIIQLNFNFESKYNNLKKEYDQKIDQEHQQSSKIIQDLHQLKIKEISKQAKKYEIEIDKISQDSKLQIQEYLIQIEQLKKTILDNSEIIDHLTELINTQKEQIEQQLKSHEEQMDMLRQNYSLGKEQLASVFEDRYNSVKAELITLKIEKENNEKQKQIEEKQFVDLKKKFEQFQGAINQLKEECRAYQSLLSEKTQIIDQQSLQITKQNEIIKYLQNEVENSKQVYNIFRNTGLSLHKQSDEIINKTDIKRATNSSLKFSRAKQIRQPQRALVHNQTMQFMISNADQLLPKMRSISNNQLTRTTPRHHSSQM